MHGYPPCSVVTPCLMKAGEGLMHGRVGEGRRGRERERSRSWRPPSSPQAAVAQALPHGPLRQGVCSRCARYKGMKTSTGEWRHAPVATLSYQGHTSRQVLDRLADF